MGKVLSVQGCMAVGKTSALKYVENIMPDVFISYEWTSIINKEIRDRKLDRNIFEDYIEIQKIWIDFSIRRYRIASEHKISVMDYGTEEVEFFTLNYPKSINKDWDVESALKYELKTLREYMPYRILFLDAEEKTLIRRKENDATRERACFQHHLNKLLPLRKEWFGNKNEVDFINVNALCPEEAGMLAAEWIRKYT